MKKTIVLCVVMLAASAMVLLAAVPARAVGVSAGVATWYNEWKMQGNDYVDPAFMYGPVLGLDLAKDWSLNSVFLMGNYHITPPGQELYYFRYDSDTTLNYSILKWLKVFGGFKYMRYDMDFTNEKMYVPFEDHKGKYYAYGPGLGFGVTIPLTDSLFVLGNFSGLYLQGHFTMKGQSAKEYVDKGYNTTLSLAYYISSLPMTIAAGVRYQWIQDVEQNVPSDTNAETIMKYYGITLSAVYHFNTDSEK
jgi:hypothetical protein